MNTHDVVIRKVLAVDDEPTVLNGYRLGFSTLHTQVFIARSGQLAIPLAIAERPDLVVIDLCLHGEWGITLIRRIRKILPDAKIALVSGYISVGSAVGAIRAGADHVIPKPTVARQILREVTSTDEERDHEAAARPVEPFPTLAHVEREHIQRALYECEGSVSAAARLLRMGRSSLQRKLKRLAPPI